MKLRIKGSTLRLRLSKTEVKNIGNGFPVNETVYFGGEVIFKYVLSPEDTDHIKAEYAKDTIKVIAPKEKINKWCSNEEEVGFEETISHQDGTSLYVLVEKDYKCLDEREEDESNLFENPNAGKNC